MNDKFTPAGVQHLECPNKLVVCQTLIFGLMVVDEVTSPHNLCRERTRDLVHYPKF
ncbi:hypothetical protein EC9_06840 [Rosistilla ulvae]|uniref:Uncharacterized protein n=1 Tax=Rosistilla ulvae TaxID=1930277 RepID=A0A517LV73_9BACT|nr:hypothetical protein EC9_06840 [Rosistilla ulvae]